MLRKLEDIKTLKDPLKQYMIDFSIPEIPAVLAAKTMNTLTEATGATFGKTWMASIKDFKFRATSFSYPSCKIKQIETVVNGFTKKIGILQDKSGVWKCNVIDDYKGGIIQLIQSWCDCIHNTEFGITLPSVLYSTTCQITINKPTGNAVEDDDKKRPNARKIYLRGFYPISYSVGEINTSSSDPVTCSVEFNYDFYSYGKIL